MNINRIREPRFKLRLDGGICTRGLPKLIELDFRFDDVAASCTEHGVDLFQLLRGERVRRIDFQNASEFHFGGRIIFFFKSASTRVKMSKRRVVSRLFILQSELDVLWV